MLLQATRGFNPKAFWFLSILAISIYGWVQKFLSLSSALDSRFQSEAPGRYLPAKIRALGLTLKWLVWALLTRTCQKLLSVDFGWVQRASKTKLFSKKAQQKSSKDSEEQWKQSSHQNTEMQFTVTPHCRRYHAQLGRGQQPRSFPANF